MFQLQISSYVTIRDSVESITWNPRNWMSLFLISDKCYRIVSGAVRSLSLPRSSRETMSVLTETLRCSQWILAGTWRGDIEYASVSGVLPEKVRDRDDVGVAVLPLRDAVLHPPLGEEDVAGIDLSVEESYSQRQTDPHVLVKLCYETRSVVRLPGKS